MRTPWHSVVPGCAPQNHEHKGNEERTTCCCLSAVGLHNRVIQDQTRIQDQVIKRIQQGVSVQNNRATVSSFHVPNTEKNGLEEIHRQRKTKDN